MALHYKDSKAYLLSCYKDTNDYLTFLVSDWQNAVIGLLIFSVAFGFLAMILSICGVCALTLPKKIYYYHSAGEIYFICGKLLQFHQLIITKELLNAKSGWHKMWDVNIHIHGYLHTAFMAYVVENYISYLLLFSNSRWKPSGVETHTIKPMLKTSTTSHL